MDSLILYTAFDGWLCEIHVFWVVTTKEQALGCRGITPYMEWI